MFKTDKVFNICAYIICILLDSDLHRILLKKNRDESLSFIPDSILILQIGLQPFVVLHLFQFPDRFSLHLSDSFTRQT